MTWRILRSVLVGDKIMKDQVNLNWLITHVEQCSKRYMEAESFLFIIAEMPWYKRMIPFYQAHRINKFINKQLDHYDF